MNENPSNSDIMEAIGGLREKAEHIARTGEIERGKIYEQARKTNGRVNRIEDRLNVIDKILVRFQAVEDWLHDFKTELRIRKQIKGEDHDIRVNQNVEKQVVRNSLIDPADLKKLIVAVAAFFLAASTYIGTRL